MTSSDDVTSKCLSASLRKLMSNHITSSLFENSLMHLLEVFASVRAALALIGGEPAGV